MKQPSADEYKIMCSFAQDLTEKNNNAVQIETPTHLIEQIFNKDELCKYREQFDNGEDIIIKRHEYFEDDKIPTHTLLLFAARWSGKLRFRQRNIFKIIVATHTADIAQNILIFGIFEPTRKKIDVLNVYINLRHQFLILLTLKITRLQLLSNRATYCDIYIRL